MCLRQQISLLSYDAGPSNRRLTSLNTTVGLRGFKSMAVDFFNGGKVSNVPGTNSNRLPLHNELHSTESVYFVTFNWSEVGHGQVLPITYTGHRSGTDKSQKLQLFTINVIACSILSRKMTKKTCTSTFLAPPSEISSSDTSTTSNTALHGRILE